MAGNAPLWRQEGTSLGNEDYPISEKVVLFLGMAAIGGKSLFVIRSLHPYSLPSDPGLIY